MPTFDVVSEVDMQEVRNAVDQAERDLTTRFDFKGTGSTIELAGHEVTLRSSTEDRLKAVVQVLEEKLVRRKTLAEGSRLREGRGSGQKHRPPAGDHQSRDKFRPGQGHQQVHQGQGAQGRVFVDPRGPGKGVVQEARRTTSVRSRR